MPSFKKAILREGEYFSPDRPDEPIVVTKERLQNWEAQHQKITKSRRTIPIDFDHSYTPEDNVPITRASHDKRRSAQNSVGTMEVFRVAEDDAGSYAEILLDVTDPIAQGRCSRNEVYVSPVILDEWTDGRGNQYTDVIGHMDLVNHPVDDSQEPFVAVEEAGAVACSLRMGLGTPQHPNVFRLAIGDKNMADDDKKKEEDDDDGMVHPPSNEEGDDGQDGENFGDDAGEERVGGDGEASGGSDMNALAAQVMDKIGAEVPTAFDPMTPEGFTLLMTAVLNRLDSDGDDELGEEGDGQLEAQAPEFATLSTQSKTAFNYAEKQHKQTVAQRLSAAFLSGRVSKTEFEEKQSLCNTVKLSLDKDGNQRPNRFEAWLEAREELPAGSVWPGENNQATHLSASAAPTSWNPNPHNAPHSAERTKEIADWVLGVK